MQSDLQGEQRSSKAEKKELLVVSNLSAIIAFAKICRLDLLEKLFKKVIIPEAVWKEVTVEGKPGREKILRAGFIHVVRVHNKRLTLFLKEFVDEGEAEAITLALEVNTDILLIDDRMPETLAKKLGLQVMGTLGVLALAKYRRLIQEVKPIIDELMERGFRISKRILEEFLKELDEL